MPSAKTEDPLLSAARRRDEQTDHHTPLVRRVALTAIGIFILLALLNVFGQNPSESRASAEAATLTVTAPDRLRGGLIYQARVDIEAKQQIKDPRLALAKGWVDHQTMNALTPAPTEEDNDGPNIIYTYDPIPAGAHRTVWMDFEANPVNMGSGSQDLALYDGDPSTTQPIARVERTVMVFP